MIVDANDTVNETVEEEIDIEVDSNIKSEEENKVEDNKTNNSSSSSNNSNTSNKEDNKTESDKVESNTSIYKDGVYTGNSSGYHGNITVKVTIKNDNIVSVQVIDTVSGPTYSSKRIINAVNNALAKARI